MIKRSPQHRDDQQCELHGVSLILTVGSKFFVIENSSNNANAVGNMFANARADFIKMARIYSSLIMPITVMADYSRMIFH
jgi:hypothetical protein